MLFDGKAGPQSWLYKHRWGCLLGFEGCVQGWGFLLRRSRSPRATPFFSYWNVGSVVTPASCAAPVKRQHGASVLYRLIEVLELLNTVIQAPDFHFVPDARCWLPGSRPLPFSPQCFSAHPALSGTRICEAPSPQGQGIACAGALYVFASALTTRSPGCHISLVLPCMSALQV